MRHNERHRSSVIGWLRAAVLGANDGLVSTASLLVGMVSAGSDAQTVMIAGVAGLVAGSSAMAAGEYVSVASQADTELADLARERGELSADPTGEANELAAIYELRGLEPTLARQVAQQLMARDALAAHARDELGLSQTLSARPLQAAATSAASFAVGAAWPLTIVALVPRSALLPWLVGASLVGLLLLGTLAAQAGGASKARSAIRIAAWGIAALALTAAVAAFVPVKP